MRALALGVLGQTMLLKKGRKAISSANTLTTFFSRTLRYRIKLQALRSNSSASRHDLFSDELNSANLECPFFATVESGFLTTAGERGVFWKCFGKVLEKNCDGDHDDEAKLRQRRPTLDHGPHYQPSTFPTIWSLLQCCDKGPASSLSLSLFYMQRCGQRSSDDLVPKSSM